MEKDKKEDNGSIAVARSQVRTHVQRRVKLNNTSIKKLKPKEKPYSIGNVFFMHMIFMDSDSKLGMNLGDTYFVTENANERLY